MLDIRHPCDLAAFPAIADRIGRYGFLLGNTRALWPAFLAARREEDDPLDNYIERLVGEPAVFAHRQYDGAWLPFQRVAIASGLAAQAPNHLLVHPIYGPWFALRAIVPGPPCTNAPIALPCACAQICAREACAIGQEHRYGDDQIAFHRRAAEALYMRSGTK